MTTRKQAAADPAPGRVAPEDAGQLSLRLLRVFLAVVETGGVTRAAETLGVVQAAVSRAIAEIETILGAPVLSRSGRGALLTELGEHMQIVARRVTGEVNVLESRIGVLRHGPSIVSVGIQSLLANPLLARTTLEVKKLWPQATLRFIDGMEAELFQNLRGGRMDLVIASPRLGQVAPGLSSLPLHTERTKVYATPGHPVLRSGRFDWPELVRHAWVLPVRGLAHRDSFDQLLQDLELEPPVNIIEVTAINRLTMLLPTIRALFSASTNQGDELAARGRAVAIDVTIRAGDKPLAIFWNRHVPLATAAQVFRDALVRCHNELFGPVAAVTGPIPVVP